MKALKTLPLISVLFLVQTLPAGAIELAEPTQFVPGTAISSSAMNANFANIYTALTTLIVPTVQVFANAGAAQAVTIPTGATGVMIEVIGGGGGAGGGVTSPTAYGGNGGNGAYGKGYFAITNGDSLSVTVGAGGAGGAAGICTGEMYSAIITATAGQPGGQSNVTLDDSPIIAAGGGLGGSAPTAMGGCTYLYQGTPGTAGSATAPISISLTSGSTKGDGGVNLSTGEPTNGVAGGAGYAIFTFY